MIVAALVDAGDLGRWAASRLSDGEMMAPHLFPVEVAATLRRHVASGSLLPPEAESVLAQAVGLSLELYPVAPFAEREAGR